MIEHIRNRVNELSEIDFVVCLIPINECPATIRPSEWYIQALTYEYLGTSVSLNIYFGECEAQVGILIVPYADPDFFDKIVEGAKSYKHKTDLLADIDKHARLEQTKTRL